MPSLENVVRAEQKAARMSSSNITMKPKRLVLCGALLAPIGVLLQFVEFRDSRAARNMLEFVSNSTSTTMTLALRGGSNSSSSSGFSPKLPDQLMSPISDAVASMMVMMNGWDGDEDNEVVKTGNTTSSNATEKTKRYPRENNDAGLLQQKIPVPRSEPTEFLWANEWVDQKMSLPLKPTIYLCIPHDGNSMGELKSILMDIAPEYQFVNLANLGNRRRNATLDQDWLNNVTTTDKDLFATAAFVTRCPTVVDQWWSSHYQGENVLGTGEDHDTPSNLDNRTFFFGSRNPEPGQEHHVMRLYYLQMIHWFHLRHQGRLDNNVTTDQTKLFRFPRGLYETKEHYLIYGQSNCVPFRQAAFDRLSEIGMTHIGGKCQGTTQNSNKTKVNTGVSLFNWWGNFEAYKNYRFCLTMEHSNSDGYVTEKILMAFMAGCVPIYYGTTEIFDLFNKEAFIFYDIDSPQEALARIAYLESHPDAYNTMMKQPVFAHGDDTIREYFSFSEDVGGGYLKNKMREMLGIDTIA